MPSGRNFSEALVSDRLDTFRDSGLGDGSPSGFRDAVAAFPGGNGGIGEVHMTREHGEVGELTEDQRKTIPHFGARASKGDGGVGTGHAEKNVQDAQPVSITMTDRPSERLKRLRISAGYETATDAAKAIGCKVITYLHHENGRRKISRGAAEEYARFYRVPAGSLLYGEQLQTIKPVPILGFVLDRGEVRMMTDITAFASDPPKIQIGTELVAFVVETDELWPAYRRGDTIYCDRDGSIRNLSELSGKDCFVQLEDGTQLLRQVVHQAGDRVTLIAYGGPPMLNVRIISAQRVRWLEHPDN
jgi:hypothetical protein